MMRNALIIGAVLLAAAACKSGISTSAETSRPDQTLAKKQAPDPASATSSGRPGASSDAAIDATPPTAISTAPLNASALTPKSFRLSWNPAADDTTATAALEYRLCLRPGLAFTDLHSVDERCAGNDWKNEFAANVLSIEVTGLLAGETYQAAVVVRDAALNRALLGTFSVATAADTMAPVPGTAPTVHASGITSDSAHITWDAATDDITEALNLAYRLCVGEGADFTDLASVTAGCSGDAWKTDFTANGLAFDLTGLAPGQTYRLAVVVRDAAQNEALVGTTTVSTLAIDSDPPTPGTAPTIHASSVTANSFRVDWDAATDNVTAASALAYRLCVDQGAAFTDLASVNAGCADGDWQTAYTVNGLGYDVSNLAPSQTYRVAVVVRDAALNAALLGTATVSMLADTTPPSPGTAPNLHDSLRTATTAHLEWDAATDLVTPQASLEYRLCVRQGAAFTDLSSVTGSCAGGDWKTPYTANALAFDLTGLAEQTTYRTAVLVRDAAANVALLGTHTFTTTIDGLAPTPSAPTLSSKSFDRATIAWTAATDDVTSTASLQYRVCKHFAADSVAGTLNGKLAACAGLWQSRWSENLLGMTVMGLMPATAYRFEVYVRDARANVAAATALAVTTNARTGRVFFVASAFAGLGSGAAAVFRSGLDGVQTGLLKDTDAFGAFADAVAAANAVPGTPATIYLGAETFTTAAALTMQSDLAIYGVDSAASILQKSFASTADSGAGSTWLSASNQNIVVANLRVDGAGPVTAHALSVTDGSLAIYNADFRNIYYSDFEGRAVVSNTNDLKVINSAFSAIQALHVQYNGPRPMGKFGLIEWNEFQGDGAIYALQNAIYMRETDGVTVVENTAASFRATDGSYSSACFFALNLTITYAVDISFRRNLCKNSTVAFDLEGDGSNFVSATARDNTIINQAFGDQGAYLLKAAFDAPYNYWGDANGPLHSSNPSGTLLEIDEDTDGSGTVTPFLTTAPLLD